MTPRSLAQDVTAVVIRLLTECANAQRAAGARQRDRCAADPGPAPANAARAPAAGQPPSIEDLVYELLDAHHDTARLAADVQDDACWQAHLDYLAGLQRIGREMLAQMSSRSPVTRLDGPGGP
jgi:hypothetical protein